MTHNTREVEEVKQIARDIVQVVVDNWPEYHLMTGRERNKLFDGIKPILHHQLQKAREEWLREEIVRLEGMKKTIDYTDSRVTALDRNKYYRLKGYEQGSNKTLQTIKDRHQSELDQPINSIFKE